MYGYSKYTPLTKTEILKRVTEEQIFNIVIKESIQKDKEFLYKAPYRIDNNPKCYFEIYKDTLCFIDFADMQNRSKDCFNFISRYFNVDYFRALEIINNHFNLGLGNSLNPKEETIIKNDLEERKIIKSFNRDKTITIIPRKFNNKDKNYWIKYNISKNNLVEDKVIPILLYRAMSKDGNYYSITCMDISYAYSDFNNKVKIYRPLNEKFKWSTNCNQNDIGSFFKLINSGELLIITKSYKDCRVLRNLQFNSIWLQSECMFPSKDILKNLCDRFKKIIIWFDNDSTGITNANVLKNIINSIENKCETIFLPPVLLQENIKDPSDLVAIKGENNLIEFLKLKNLL